MPLSSWQLCLLSDRISVIKHDSLSFFTETLKVSLPPFADYTFDLLWIALFVMCESLCCWLHFVVLMQLINAKGGNCKTAPWQKHKSKKQPDMTETSPWLWWVTTRAKQQWAAVALEEIERVNAWGMTWGGIILIRHTDSSRGLDLSPFFQP